MPSLKYLTISARAEHTATVIFVHGLGDSAHGWQWMATMFSQEPEFGGIKWILPDAPKRAVTANGGTVMGAWYDIFAFDFTSGEDEAGILDSSRSLSELIATEVANGIPAGRIVLGGFSQGGTMSLVTGLISEWRLGGIINLSGRLAMKDKVKEMLGHNAKFLPIFWGHGIRDPLVKYEGAQQSVQFINNDLGICVATEGNIIGLEFHAYDGLVHSVSDHELQDLRAWLRRVTDLPLPNNV